jgi:competence protein CoiA
MQLYAKESQNSLIFATKALKHVDYTCIECSQTVRLRSGIHRQPHFYHLRPNESCNQHGKSMTHLMLQCHLQTLLPINEAQLECRFASINRIADVAWHAKKIIFEIQCSPITATEVLARNADYLSLGFQVIWILHDSRFNQWRMSAAEHALEEHPYYFTNMNSEGKGIIYEQLAINHQGIRKERAIQQLVNLASPQEPWNISIDLDSTLIPKMALKRIQPYQIYFEGDAAHHCIKHFTEENSLTPYLESLNEIELRWLHLFDTETLSSMPLTNFLKLFCKRLLIEPYCAVMRLLLEKACK